MAASSPLKRVLLLALLGLTAVIGLAAIFLDTEDNGYGLSQERPMGAAQTVRHISASIDRPSAR